MKFLMLLLVLMTASSQPIVKTWSLEEISSALSTCINDSCVAHPYLVAALNKIMFALFTETDVENVYGALPSPTGSETWTKQEIFDALENHTGNVKYRYYLMAARNRLDYQKDKTEPVQVLIPAVDISTWTLDDLSKTLNDSSTSSKLITYLKPAYTQLQENMTSGKSLETISVITPPGLLKNENGTSLLFPMKKI